MSAKSFVMIRIVHLGAAALIVLVCGCAIETGLPFPSSFKMLDVSRFEFATKGSWEFPANSRSGEEGRLRGLRIYMAQRGICSSGYEILNREKERVAISPKHSVEEQELLRITYTGRCKASSVPSTR